MKVYIITSGGYSSYMIECVCETMEIAQRKCIELISDYSFCYPYRIEVWDTESGDCAECNGKRYHVWWDSGKIHCEFSDFGVCVMEGSTNILHDRIKYFSIDGLRANDEAHALKIASDLLAEYKALLEGV